MKIEFDPKKVLINHDNMNRYHVTYFLYKSNKPIKDISSKNFKGLYDKCKIMSEIKTACFANATRFIGNSNKANKDNKLTFLCDLDFSKQKLTTEEIERWVELCQENNLLIHEVNKEFFKNGHVTVDVGVETRVLTYIHLCCLRAVQEKPAYVRAVLHICDDIGVNFFVALSVAGAYCMYGTGHHFMRVDRYNSGGPKLDDEKTIYNLLDSRKLFLLVNYFRHYESVGGGYGLFNTFNKIKTKDNKFKIERGAIGNKKTTKMVVGKEKNYEKII